MIFDYAILKFIWFFLIGVLMIGFAVTGGFDLGVGALLPFVAKTDDERRTLLNSIGPTWEGNQVWLITAAGAIFAAWPLMYAVSFSSLYAAFMLILLALILRPPGIDYRSKLPSLRWRQGWDMALFVSALLPIILFGVAFGNVLQGIPFHFDDTMLSHYTGRFVDLLNPFALLCGFTSLCVLVFYGAQFIQLKTVDALNARAKNISLIFGGLFILSFSLLWYWTVFYLPGFQLIGDIDPNQALSPVTKQVAVVEGGWGQNYGRYPIGYAYPILCIIAALLANLCSATQRVRLAMCFGGIATGAVIATLGFTLYPFILPSSSQPHHSLTLWDAASSPLTLSWMLVATLVFLPIVLAYTSWVYYVMRGKVKPEQALTQGKEAY